VIHQLKYYFLPLLIFCLASCNASVKSDPPAVVSPSPPQTSAPWPTPKGQQGLDPNSNEHVVLVSKTVPQVITRNVLQAKDGNIWLATWSGIVGYDGEVFTNYTKKYGLRPDRVFSLLEDREDNIWFGTIGGGVYRFDGESFTNITTANGLGSNEIECMMQDNAGNIWFGTGTGVSRYDGKTFHNFSQEDGLPDSDIHSIAQDQSGKIWVASTAGISYLESQVFVPFYKTDGQPFSNPRIILSDKTGALWFGGQDGLVRYDGTTLTTLLKDFVGYLYEDRAGDIWISVISGSLEKTGLHRFAANSYPLPFAKNKFTQVLKVDNMSFGITEDEDGNIWLGTLAGVCRYDGEGFEWFREEEE
jgi:ligand-binding sensor domain-containing protein